MILIATLYVGLLGILGIALLHHHGMEAHHNRKTLARLGKHIDTYLPQTQCGECGFAGCRPYAQAIATQHADINRCGPGGKITLQTLTRMTGRMPQNFSLPERMKHVAHIDETQCIACKRCLYACPVDAIIGAEKQIHSVLPMDCTGCGLCLPACPVDCIQLVASPARMVRT